MHRGRVLSLFLLVLLAGISRATAAAPDSTTAAPLSDDEKHWIREVVAPLITPPEKKVFESLAAPYQRKEFILEFWRLRERPGLPPPYGPGFRQLYESRLEAANEKYGGWRSDPGRIVLALGEPIDVVEIDCPNLYRPIEIWTMESRTGSSIQKLLFYREALGAPLRLWTPDLGRAALSASRPDAGGGFNAGTCPEAKTDELMEALAIISSQGAGGAAAEIARLETFPAPAEEDWGRWKSRFAGPETSPTAPATPLDVRAPATPPASAPAPPSSEPATSPASMLSPELSMSASPLSDDERRWADEDVAPLISPEEKKIYLSLKTPYERTEFQREFWRIREQPGLPLPFGPSFKSTYERRKELADTEYGGWKTDAGRTILALGEPQNIVKIDCPSAYRPIEIWTEAPMSRQGAPIQLIFYRDYESGPLRLWTRVLGDEALLSPAGVADGRTFLQVIGSRCGPAATEAACALECTTLYPAYLKSKEHTALEEVSLVEHFLKFPPPPESDWSSWRSKFVNSEAPPNVASIVAHAPPAQAPAATFHELDRKERKTLEAGLPEKYRTWLDHVDLIITDRERDVYLQIKDDVDRDRFIEEFWRRRSIDKDGIATNYRKVYNERLQYALETFGDLHSDAAKMFLINGPPDSIVPIDCPEVFVPIRIWYYERIEAIKSKAYLIFYRPYGMRFWALWTPIDSTDRLYAHSLVQPGEAEQQCFDAGTLREAITLEQTILGNGPSGMVGVAKLFAPPPVETEGIDRFLGMTTQLSGDAAKIPLQKSVVFPEERNGKIACDVSVLVGRDQLAVRDLGAQKFFDMDLVGEVITNDRLLDNFKYRFDIPIDEAGSSEIPLTIRRYLYPGTYKLRLKISDANRKAEGRLEEDFTVPEKPDAPAAPRQASAAGAATAASGASGSAGDFRPSSITILTPVREILTGLQRFETKAAEGIMSVDFYLDGTKVITKTRRPFDADLNLGPIPRRHTVRVVAFDHEGRDVGEDDLSVNEGSESFRVKIVSPRKGAAVSGPTEVVAEAVVPESHHVAKMEFYSDNTRIATLYQPPWQQLVPIRKTGSLGYVRVVGTLDDGLVAEDLRYVNAPPYISEINVDAVELYTTVTQGGHPVTNLKQDNFKVLEDNQPQTIAQFERVTNLPISVGVAIDTSASMIENLPEAEQAALDFISATVGDKDRAFTMSFDDAPYTLCRLTSDHATLQRSFAGLRAEGSTALYDALVYGLFQFTGVKGKKALVVLTDGKDTASKYDFDTVLDYVKKSGVSVYGIGLNIGGTELEVKAKLNRLAEASGGETFYIKNPKSLPTVYKQINEELRSQYLLTYYSTNTNTDNKWRSVEVKMKPSSLKARTISGYYP